MTEVQISYFANKYAGKCIKCGKRVPALQGACYKSLARNGFNLGCTNCFPVECAAIYKATREQEAKQLAKEAELEARRLQLLAERAAIIKKLGIDFQNVYDLKTQQYAYSDVSEWKVKFEGDGSDQEFLIAVNTPSQSIGYSLRASNGIKLQKIDRVSKTLTISESISIAD